MLLKGTQKDFTEMSNYVLVVKVMRFNQLWFIVIYEICEQMINFGKNSTKCDLCCGENLFKYIFIIFSSVEE